MSNIREIKHTLGYAVIAALIAISIYGILTLFGFNSGSLFSRLVCGILQYNTFTSLAVRIKG